MKQPPESSDWVQAVDKQVQAALREPSVPALIVLAGGVLALIGALLPWTAVIGLFGYQVTSNGGILAVLLSLAMAGIGVWMLVTPPPHLRKTIGAMTCAGILVVVALGTALLAPSIASSQRVLISVGAGPYVSLIGSAICLVGASLQLRGRRA